MTADEEVPVCMDTDGDSVEKLYKINDSTSVVGLSDGVQAAYVFSPQDWMADAENAAKAFAALGEVFSVDSLRRHGVTEPDKPQRWGSLFAVLQNRGVIELVSLQLHRTQGGAQIPVRQWRGVSGSGSRAAA